MEDTEPLVCLFFLRTAPARREQVGLAAERPADTLKEDSSAGESETTAILDMLYATLEYEKQPRYSSYVVSTRGWMVKRSRVVGVYSLTTRVYVWFPEY